MSEEVLEVEIDKSGWPDGPWKTEPDRLQWQHAGYACLILRNHHGNLCGYVAIDRAHPLYGKDYDEADGDLRVHGGLTYADRCQGLICHVPEPGMPDDVWWFGFDCAHLMDLVPGMFRSDVLKKMPPEIVRIEKRHLLEDTYRDLAYVKAETESLADQLRALA